MRLVRQRKIRPPCQPKKVPAVKLTSRANQWLQGASKLINFVPVVCICVMTYFAFQKVEDLSQFQTAMIGAIALVGTILATSGGPIEKATSSIIVTAVVWISAQKRLTLLALELSHTERRVVFDPEEAAAARYCAYYYDIFQAKWEKSRPPSWSAHSNSSYPEKSRLYLYDSWLIAHRDLVPAKDYIPSRETLLKMECKDSIAPTIFAKLEVSNPGLNKFVFESVSLTLQPFKRSEKWSWEYSANVWSEGENVLKELTKNDWYRVGRKAKEFLPGNRSEFWVYFKKGYAMPNGTNIPALILPRSFKVHLKSYNDGVKIGEGESFFFLTEDEIVNSLLRKGDVPTSKEKILEFAKDVTDDLAY